MNTRIPMKTFTLSTTGGTDGYLPVTANTGAYPGSKAWLNKADGSLPQLVLVTDLSGADKIGVRFIRENARDAGVKHPIYGRSDASAYGSGATLNVFAQVVETQASTDVALPAANV